MNLFLLHHRAAPVVLCRRHQPRPATTRSTTTTPTAVRMTTIFGPPSAHPAQTVATPIFAASRVSIWVPIAEGVTSLHGVWGILSFQYWQWKAAYQLWLTNLNATPSAQARRREIRQYVASTTQHMPCNIGARQTPTVDVLACL